MGCCEMRAGFNGVALVSPGVKTRVGREHTLGGFHALVGAQHGDEALIVFGPMTPVYVPRSGVARGRKLHIGGKKWQ